jgi:hypothetical protein
MKPLLTRAFTRDVLTVAVVAAAGWGLAGLAAGPALAQPSGPTAAVAASAASVKGAVNSVPGPMRAGPIGPARPGDPVPGNPWPGGPPPSGPWPGWPGHGGPWGWPGHGGPWPGHGWPWHPQAELWITVRDSPSSPVLHWTLTCGPDGGTLPGPARACWQLSQAGQPFAPVPPGVMCPMIYFGPQTATVTGYWYGTWISVRFGRSDGCQEARWNKVISALGLTVQAGEVNPGGPMQPGPVTPVTH